MNRLHITALVLVLLLSQWGSIDHVYHVHDTAEVCDYCLSAQVLDHAVTSIDQIPVVSPFFQYQPGQASLSVFENGFNHYAARAPPQYI